MATQSGQDKRSTETTAQLAAKPAGKLPPDPPIPQLTRWRMTLHALLTDPAIDRRPLWYLLIRIGITVLIAISLFGVGGQVGFTIAAALFVVGVGVSLRVRRF
jgi:hypothetical protein